LSRARASTLVDRGARVDGELARASDRVHSGQIITCPEPEESNSLAPESIDFGVLYEDESVIVVDKPPGLVVHPGSGRQKGTLAAGLIYRYPELVGVGAEERCGLVHRLDKDTSGALLVARTDSGFDFFADQLRHRRIERVYTALVEGQMGAPTGTIEAPIGRDPVRPTRRAIVHGAKLARTHYEVVAEYDEMNLSLLKVRLETGRTHQIRVHMAAIEHPVAGDVTYGATRKAIASPRTFLHASSLTFTHPETGRRMKVESPLPSDLAAVLARLS
ncbi:MAG TPA: RluA family pseudouridine synthase, partial [Acidimicrobiia bacterium]|nr:RluA family pseudouridine synthase [Acidimicrobiia bacterium]